EFRTLPLPHVERPQLVEGLVRDLFVHARESPGVRIVNHDDLAVLAEKDVEFGRVRLLLPGEPEAGDSVLGRVERRPAVADDLALGGGGAKGGWGGECAHGESEPAGHGRDFWGWGFVLAGQTILSPVFLARGWPACLPHGEPNRLDPSWERTRRSFSYR